jgi:hypothetical protein
MADIKSLQRCCRPFFFSFFFLVVVVAVCGFTSEKVVGFNSGKLRRLSFTYSGAMGPSLWSRILQGMGRFGTQYCFIIFTWLA